MERHHIENALLDEYRKEDIETKRREELWKKVEWHPTDDLIKRGITDRDEQIRKQVWANPHWKPTQEHFTIGKADKSEVIKDQVFTRELNSLEERYDDLIEQLKHRQEESLKTLAEMKQEREARARLGL